MTYNVYANGSKTVRAFLRFSLAGCLEHFQMHVCMYVLRICELHTPWMLRFGMGWRWGWGWVGWEHVYVHVNLHTPWMLRCSSSCEVAQASDATLWYGLGLGSGGAGACSRSCEVAHVSDATPWYGLGVGLGGVGHVHVHVKLHTSVMLRPGMGWGWGWVGWGMFTFM